MQVPSTTAVATVILVAACATDAGVATRPADGRPAMPSASPAPTASASPVPTPADRLTGDGLVALIAPPDLRRHLEAFQEIADAHSGNRATGSSGFAASLDYVTEMLEAGGYEVARYSFQIDGVDGTNLLVEKPGTGPGVVMLGAHLDTVAAGPGLNDNGSGVAAVLTIAEALAELPPTDRTIRLAFWDAEEGGARGSRAYLEGLSQAELERTGAYLNLDIIGSPNAIRLVYAEPGAALGSENITDLFAAHFDSAGLSWEPIDLEGDSDHGPFTAAGIPTGGLFSGGIELVTDVQATRFGAIAGVPADACSHRSCDTLANVDIDTLVEMARAAADVLATVAASADDR